jgi:hypothetical protein
MKLPELLIVIKARANDLRDPDHDAKLDEIRQYLTVGDLLPTTIDFNKPKSIRQAQRAVSTIEARLDRIVTLHHDAKRVLQVVAAVEHHLLSFMSRSGDLPDKATGPAQQQKLNQYAPTLVKVRIQWTTLDILCTQAQQRLASARDSLKLQAKLDDNLRWAQERAPG